MGTLACENEATNMLTDSCGTEEEWEISAGSRHEIPQFASTGTKIQDGRAGNVVYNGTRRGLYVYGKSTRWLLPHQYGPKHAPIYGPKMKQEVLWTMWAIITHLRHFGH